MFAFLLICLTLLVFCQCTAKERAKKFGGTITVTLPPGTKLMSATWKESNLWYQYRPMRIGEVPETSTFQEDSNYGINEGKVIFVESK